MQTKEFVAKASALMAGKWVQEAFKFLLLLWLARTNQAGFGLFVFAAGIALMIRSLLTLGLEQFTLRELMLDSDARGRVLGQMIRLKVLVGLLAIGGILVFGWVKSWQRTEILVVLIISGGQVLEGVADTLFSLYRSAGRQVLEAAYSATASLLGALYGGSVLLWGGGIVAVSCFVIIASAVKVLLAAALGIKTRLMPPISCWGSFLPARRVSAMLMIVAVSFLGSWYNQVQIFLLKEFRTIGDLALYGAASELTGGLAGLFSAFIIGGVLYPALAQAAVPGTAGLAAVVTPYFWRLASFGLGVAFFFLTVGGDLLTLIYGSQYTGSIAPLQILGLATLLSFVNNFLIYAFLAQRQERLLILFHLIPAIFSLGLGLVLIPRLGASGAALNLLACRGIMTILTLAAAQKYYQLFNRTRVGTFLWGGLILFGSYFGMLAIDLPIRHLAAVLALISYGWWTWHWTLSSANPWATSEGAGYEPS